MISLTSWGPPPSVPPEMWPTRSVKQKLSDCYKDLGKRCYQAMKKGESLDLSAEIAKIDEALARIQAIRDRRDVTNVTPEPKPEATPTADGPDFVIVEE